MKLRKITQQDLKHLWEIGFTQEDVEWAKWDAPYFEEYKVISFDEFIATYKNWFQSEQVLGIEVDGHLIGMVSCYWEDERTRWLEIGIIIYQENEWSKGYGTRALKQWITQVFATYPQIARVGLTTWSGNYRMMKAAEKLGMKQEAFIRKVRYYQGIYYDSVKYGILREEWETKK